MLNLIIKKAGVIKIAPNFLPSRIIPVRRRNIEDNNRDFLCAQLLVSGFFYRMLEKRWPYSGSVHELLMNYKKALYEGEG
jgi:hypothetical protein